MENKKHNDPKSMGYCKGVLKREVYSNSLSQEIIKISNKQPILTPKGTREKTKPKVSRKKEIIKIREEINETETKKKIEIINKTKIWFFEKIKFISL